MTAEEGNQGMWSIMKPSLGICSIWTGFEEQEKPQVGTKVRQAVICIMSSADMR